MAKNSDNLFTEGFRGTVGGNMTFSRRRSGKVIVSKRRGPSSIPPTEGQLQARERFKVGSIYAKAVMADPENKKIYADATTGDQTAYNLALRDAIKAPVVHSIDASGYAGLPGNRIVVRATDDFKVTGVKVSLRTAAGDLLEEGNAVMLPTGLDWAYTATSILDQFSGAGIKATAFDLPLNEDSLEIIL